MDRDQENADRASSTLRVGAVQMDVRVGDPAGNVARAERAATEALDRGACVVALPEFFTTPCIVHPRVAEAVVTPDSAPVRMLVSLARRYRAYVGGSMLMRRGEDVYNTYCLACPDGAVATHDKDQPTMWENAHYVGGRDEGVVNTEHGTAGIAVCWEMIRWRTVRRFAGRVRFAITGNQWWTLADNWPLAPRLLAPLAQFNRYLSENAPVEFARLLQVPVVHASHCGEFVGKLLLSPGTDAGIRYASRFVGRTQIVDAGGRVVAARDARDGPGVVVGDIELGAPAVSPPDTDRFWIPDLPLFHRVYWYHQNACGRSYYLRRRRSLTS